MDAGGCFGMKQIKGGDVAPTLAALGVAVVIGVPARGFFGMQAEVVHLLAGRQVDARVLLQQLVQARGAPLLGAYPEEMGQA